MKLTKQQAGQRGGLATLARHGREHMAAIGKRGARTFWKRYHLSPIGASDFAIVKRDTGEVVNRLYYQPIKRTAVSDQTRGGTPSNPHAGKGLLK